MNRRIICKRARCARSGTALMAAVLVVVMIAVTSMAYLQLSLNKCREQKSAVDAKRAFYMAEAGLAEAKISLASGQSGNVGSEAVSAKFGDGVFFVSAKDEGNGKTTLTSIGLCGSGRSALSIVIEKKKDSLAALGVFSDGTVTVEKGVLIDSYDSRQGSYSSQHQGLLTLLDPPTGSRLGSNADIIIRNGTKKLLSGSTSTSIYGDAHPGPQGYVMRDNGVVITGSTAPSETLVAFPEIKVPVLDTRGDLTISRTPSPLKIPSGNYGYGMFRLMANTSTEIAGPATIVADSLELMSGATLTIDAHEGPVKIYVKSYLNLQKGSTLVSPSQNPGAVGLFVDAGAFADRDGDGVQEPPATILSSGSFYGTIFAPKAAISVPASLSVYGAIAAKQLTLLAGSKIHFDQALLESSAEDAALPQVLAWRIVPLPKTPLVSLHLDILKLLQLQGIVPTIAAQAHLPIGVTPPPATTNQWNLLQKILEDHSGHGKGGQ